MILLSMLSGWVWAQAVPSQGTALQGAALTIEDALQKALEASEDVEVSEAGVDRARGQIWAARSGYAPSVAGSVGYQRTFASEYDDLFTIPGQEETDIPFGADNAWRVDLTATQPIWAGGRVAAQNDLARSQQALAETSLVSTRANTVLETARAYWNAALQDQLLSIAEATLAQVETTLAHTKLAQEVGHQPEFELLRAQVEVENQRVVVIRQRRARDTAHLQLAQALDLPGETSLQLTSTLDTDELPDLTATAVAVAGLEPREERIAVTQANESLKISEAGLTITTSQAYPSLAASAQYGWVSYPDDVLPPTDGDAWRNNFGAGIGLNIPIFNGGRVYGERLQAIATKHEAEAQRDRVNELADLDTQNATAELDAAEAQWSATSGTVSQARRAYEIAEVRYAEGVSSQSELADARILLQQALANRAQSARDLQMARIRQALLPALPVSTFVR